MSLIAIDTTLCPSRYRLVGWLTFSIVIILLVYLLPILSSYRIGLMLLIVVCLWFAQVSHTHLVKVSTLPSKNTQSTINNEFDFLDWQLQIIQGVIKVPLEQQGDIYQAKLQKISDFGWLMLLEFELSEPMIKRLTVQIWQDQMSADNWRQLKLLAL